MNTPIELINDFNAMSRLEEVTNQLENFGEEKEKLLGVIQNNHKKEIELQESLKYAQDEVNRLMLVKHNQKAQIRKIEEEYCSINKQAMICFKEIKLLKEMQTNGAISKDEEQLKLDELLKVLERLLKEGSSPKELRRRIMAVLAVTVIGDKYKKGDLGVMEPSEDK